MAKKRARQTIIPGTADPIPAEVQEAADDYVAALRKRQKDQDKESELRATALELMRQHGLEKIELDDEKLLVVEHGSDKLKIKRREDYTPSSNGAGEEEEAETEEPVEA